MGGPCGRRLRGDTLDVSRQRRGRKIEGWRGGASQGPPARKLRTGRVAVAHTLQAPPPVLRAATAPDLPRAALPTPHPLRPLRWRRLLPRNRMLDERGMKALFGAQTSFEVAGAWTTRAETVFADEVHGLWLGPGLEVERLGTVGEWTEVRTLATKPERRGFVRSADLGVAFDRLWFEEKRQESVGARDRQPFVVAYAPDGEAIAETTSGSPITITDAHVELVDLDYNAPLAVIGFVPRDLVTEPEPVETDVWGELAVTTAKSKLEPDEVLVAAKTEVFSLGGTRLGVTRDELRLKRGEDPGTVVVEMDWGRVVLVVKEKRRGRER